MGAPAPTATGVMDRAREAAQVLAASATEVDREAAFPAASVAALADARLLGAAAPSELGGLDLEVRDLAAVARALARGCSSTAMIWAMHQVQVACLARHGNGDPDLEAAFAELLAADGLIASVTSEVGVGGDLRTSNAACELSPQGVRLKKDAPTVSYGAHAAAFLITARRTSGSAAGDQVLVLATAAQTQLQQRAEWNTMGMRGTCSPPFEVEAQVAPSQVLGVPFADVAALTMVPLSHILWSAVWIGIAEEALDRATRFLRKKRASSGGATLARAARSLQLLDALLAMTIDRYVSTVQAEGISTREFGVLVNDLKLAASTSTVEIVTDALELCGMAGYAESGPFSLARLLRDLYSARLMIANARLTETNATSLLLEHYR